MLHHLDLQIVTDVSIDRNASIFTVKKPKKTLFEADDEATNWFWRLTRYGTPKMKELQSYEKSVTFNH